MNFTPNAAYYGPAGIPLPPYDHDTSSVTPPPTPFASVARNANTTFPQSGPTLTPVHNVSVTPAHGSRASRLPTISAVIVDQLAKDFQLEDVQRANLHGFFRIATSSESTLSTVETHLWLYQLAVTFGDIAERHRKECDMAALNLRELMTDIKIRLQKNFELTKEQNANLRKVAMDKIFEADRVSFKGLHSDVEIALRSDKSSVNLENVFGNPSREKSLITALKKICSSVRNGFRQDIRDSIHGENTLSLTDFTYEMACKYKHGGPGDNLDPKYLLHIALLRGFGLENMELLVKTKADDTDGEDDADEEPARKRNRGNGNLAGKPKKGADFWSQVDKYFKNNVKAYGGRDLTAPLWKAHINELIMRDNARFDSTHTSQAGPMLPTPGVGSSTPHMAVVAQGASFFDTVLT